MAVKNKKCSFITERKRVVLCNLVIFCNLGSGFKTKTKKKDKEKVRSKFRTNESHGRLKQDESCTHDYKKSFIKLI